MNYLAGIPDPAIRRLIKRYSDLRASKLLFWTMRSEVIQTSVDTILKAAVHDTKTIQEKDVYAVIQSLGYKLTEELELPRASFKRVVMKTAHDLDVRLQDGVSDMIQKATEHRLGQILEIADEIAKKKRRKTILWADWKDAVKQVNELPIESSSSSSKSSKSKAVSRKSSKSKAVSRKSSKSSRKAVSRKSSKSSRKAVSRKSSKSSRKAVSQQCKAKTIKGTRCTRFAVTKNYCKQHSK
jgi:histone H3/H4